MTRTSRWNIEGYTSDSSWEYRSYVFSAYALCFRYSEWLACYWCRIK